jgi:hypothetical protein
MILMKTSTLLNIPKRFHYLFASIFYSPKTKKTHSYSIGVSLLNLRLLNLMTSRRVFIKEVEIDRNSLKKD